MEVTLITETLDPVLGGIPRYNFEISKIKELKNVINFSKTLKNEGLLDKYLNKVYRRKKILKEDKKDLGQILHFTQPEIMFKSNILKGKKVVLTVHDLAVFGTMKVKSLYGRLRGISFRSQFRFAVERADVIMTNSTQTRDELVDILGVDPGKIVVQNLGIDEKFKPKETKKDNVIGYFGGFDRRKRVKKLVEDFIASTFSNDMKLIIYGSDKGDYHTIKEKYKSFSNVIFKDRIPEEKIADTINEFQYFVYPTSYEGFGLPLLECIACGIPSFIYEDGELPAEVRKYALVIKNLDEIKKMEYKELEKDFKSRSEQVKKEFSWDKTRAGTLEQYQKLEAKTI